MKIAIIGIRGIPAEYGGFEVTAQSIATKLARKGHSVTVYCRGFRKGRKDEYEGVNLKYLPSIELPRLSTLSHTLLAAFATAFSNYNAIFAFNVGNALQVAFLRLFGKRTVLFVDGLDWKREKYGKFGRWFLRKCEAMAARVAHRIVVDSPSAQEHYWNTYKRKVELIQSGADILQEPKPTNILEKLGIEKKKYILTVGRLTQEKRQHLIVEVFKRVRTDMKLVVVGGNPYDHLYVEKVRNSALDDPRVIMTGPIYGPQVDELYYHSAIFVNASTVEGTSLSILQAMASGCALLVSDIPENISTVRGSALTFDANSFDDFVAKLQKLVDDADFRDELSRRAIETVRSFYSWDYAVDMFEKLLLDAAGIKDFISRESQ